jgi:tetratricopeptide (TPR) repeat protein
MKMAIMLDETDYRTYVGIGTAYEHMADYPAAIEWKKQGLAASPDSAQLLFSIAYNYVTMDDYCGAIPWLKGYLEYAPEDVDNYYNLAVCYNNCKMYDSAAGVYRYMLSIDSTNADALSGMGRYFNELGRTATDSSTYYQSAGNNEEVVEWQVRKDQAFDSSRTYFGRAFRQSPDDKFVAEMFAVVHAITGKFQEAAMGFARLTELEPDNAEHWTSLGDCYLNLKEWDQAVSAYEKVVELEPGNVEIWEQLKDIYHELGNAAKETEAANKLDSLQQG